MELTKELIVELLEVQAEFDARIETKNVEDTTLAYFVELFEWINAVETPFKNWKANPGKGRDVELSELADTLAFGLSLLGQSFSRLNEKERDYILTHSVYGFDEMRGSIDSNLSMQLLAYVHVVLNEIFADGRVGHNEDTLSVMIVTPFLFAEERYSIEELVEAYKDKMAINHARQDGTADEDKGYV